MRKRDRGNRGGISRKALKILWILRERRSLRMSVPRETQLRNQPRRPRPQLHKKPLRRQLRKSDEYLEKKSFSDFCFSFGDFITLSFSRGKFLSIWIQHQSRTSEFFFRWMHTFSRRPPRARSSLDRLLFRAWSSLLVRWTFIWSRPGGHSPWCLRDRSGGTAMGKTCGVGSALGTSISDSLKNRVGLGMETSARSVAFKYGRKKTDHCRTFSPSFEWWISPKIYGEMASCFTRSKDWESGLSL